MVPVFCVALVLLSVVAAIRLPLDKVVSKTLVEGNPIAWDGHRVGYAVPVTFPDNTTARLHLDTGSSDLLVFGQLCGESCVGIGNSYTPQAVNEAAIDFVGLNAADDRNFHCCNDPDLPRSECPSSDQWPMGVVQSGRRLCATVDAYGDGTTFGGWVASGTLSLPHVPTNTSLTGSGLFSVLEVGACQGNTICPMFGDLDGIWGIAFSPLSAVGQGNMALTTLTEQNNLTQSYYLGLCPPAMEFEIGAVANHSDPQWTTVPVEKSPSLSAPCLDSYCYFTVGIDSMKLAGESFRLGPQAYSPPESNSGTIVDTGTTYLALPAPVFDVFSRLLAKSAPWASSLLGGSLVPVLPTYEQSLQLPDLTIQFTNGESITIPGWTLLRDLPSKFPLSGSVLGVSGLPPGASSSGAIIGDTVLKNFGIVFDRANKKVSFSKQPCADPVAPGAPSVKRDGQVLLVTPNLLHNLPLFSVDVSPDEGLTWYNHTTELNSTQVTLAPANEDSPCLAHFRIMFPKPAAGAAPTHVRVTTKDPSTGRTFSSSSSLAIAIDGRVNFVACWSSESKPSHKLRNALIGAGVAAFLISVVGVSCRIRRRRLRHRSSNDPRLFAAAPYVQQPRGYPASAPGAGGAYAPMQY